MDAEDLRLEALYGTLHELEARSRGANTLAPPPSARSAPIPEPLLAPDASRLRTAEARLSAAAAQSEALSRAEARLDGELVSRVFSLATKVMRAGGSEGGGAELGAAVAAFSKAISALDASRAPPPNIPVPKEIGASALDGLATVADVDAGAADAASLLRRVREIAVAQAERLAERARTARDRNGALFGGLPEPEEPGSMPELQGRAEAAAAAGLGANRMEDIAAMRSDFERVSLLEADYARFKRDAKAVTDRLSLAGEYAGGDAG